MEFADSYFEDEVREGFYVPSIMKRAWAAQLEVLSGIQELCKRHNIQYFAEWGTMLGAIRHRGMIPWDDDFDICMKSEDYQRFLSVAEELPNGCFVSDYRHSDTTDNMVARVENSHLVVVDRDTLTRYHGFPYIAGIDIFRLDYLPDEEDVREEYRELLLGIAGVVGLINAEEQSKDHEQIEEYLQMIERICRVEIRRQEPLKPQLYYLMMDYLPSCYGDKEAKELTNLPVWSENPNYRLRTEHYVDSISVPFENSEIKVPVGYESLLQQKYGGIGYMKPVRTWDSHEYPYFGQLKQYLNANTPLEVFEYLFDMEDLEWDDVARKQAREKKGKSLQDRVSEVVPLFGEAHENIQELVRNEEYETACNLLAECQDVALQVGTMIETERTDNPGTIRVLEEYCELLFRIHTCLTEEMTDDKADCLAESFGKLTEFENEIVRSVQTDLRQRREVVLIPYQVSHWSALQRVWQEVNQDPDTDVYVIPAPYYYKDEMGRLKKQEMHYEKEGYPEEVVITSYEEYNFEIHHPDIIILQYPFDEYNYALSLHPFFYSRNLKQYTEQLVYIPALAMDEIAEGDERAKSMLRYYVNTPGVMHADTVIVQSEQMKNIYVELLTEFAGEDTKELWERKILGVGSSVYEKKQEGKDGVRVPDKWIPYLKKQDGSWKKVIVYSTSVSALLMHGDKMIDKMRDVFETFRESQEEVGLIWRPDAKARDVLRRRHPALWQKYRDLVQEYRKEAWGIYDDSRETKRAVELCDAGYGDGGAVLNACRVDGKPVMLQSIV